MSEEETEKKPEAPSIVEVLRTPVAPEYVSERKGLSYVTGRYVKQTLNELFGPLGWGYEVIENYPLNPKFDDGAARWFAHVRLTIQVGERSITRDGLAVGHGVLQKEIWENRKPTGKFEDVSAGRANEVIDFAAAEAVTDALKRAASSVGQVLGLSLYPLTAGAGNSTEKSSTTRPKPKASKAGSTKAPAKGKKSGFKAPEKF